METVKDGSNDNKQKLLSNNPIFTQQLTAYTPDCNLKCAILYSIILSLLFIVFGVPIVVQSGNIVEYIQEYTDWLVSFFKYFSTPVNGFCTLNFSLVEGMKKPVFFYYGLDNFYANHRDFVKSRSFQQLRAVEDSRNYSKCDGARTVKEMFDNDMNKINKKYGTGMDINKVADPCGLTAKAYFNDEFHLFDSQNTPIEMNSVGIANDYDLEYMFKQNTSVKQWVNVTDGNIRFINN